MQLLIAVLGACRQVPILALIKLPSGVEDTGINCKAFNNWGLVGRGTAFPSVLSVVNPQKPQSWSALTGVRSGWKAAPQNCSTVLFGAAQKKPFSSNSQHNTLFQKRKFSGLSQQKFSNYFSSENAMSFCWNWTQGPAVFWNYHSACRECISKHFGPILIHLQQHNDP